MQTGIKAAIIVGVFAIVASITGVYFEKIFPPEHDEISAKITPIAGPNYVGDSIEFSAKESTPSNKISSYSWDFGYNGMKDNGQLVHHQFNKNGTYVITLTIRDNDGNTDKEQISIPIIPKLGPPSIDGPSIGSIEHIPGDLKCSWKNQWCYTLTEIDIKQKNQGLSHIANVSLKFIPSGTENIGQVDVIMTVTDPISKRTPQSMRIDTLKDHVTDVSFDVSLPTVGDYSMLFELKSPAAIEEHVFHEYTMNFEFR